ncbi:MAG: ATP-binding protein [Bacteroidia bacterium]
MNRKLKNEMSNQLTLETNPASINQVEEFVESLSKTLNFKEDVFGNVMVAVTEAVNNAIQHGNKNDPQKKIHLNFEVEKSFRLVVSVTDEGEGFNPDSLPDPTAPENLDKIGGRGVFLMQNLADELTFEEEGRRAVMKFFI